MTRKSTCRLSFKTTLVFVIPFLIALMAFRHSHQLYNRYYEEYIKHKDGLAGCRTIIENMFLPGLTSVVTDAFGIAIIGIYFYLKRSILFKLLLF